MNIDEREIKKGSLSEILPEFHPNSISYLSELNEYRMYAEMWSNKRKKEWQRRREIGHAGYLQTLEFGEKKKRRKADRVRFDYFVVANSINYRVKGIAEPAPYLRIGGIQDNSIFNEIISANRNLYKLQSLYPGADSHSKEYVPETLEIDLWDLGLRPDNKTRKSFFEIPTDTIDFPNLFRKEILLHVLGRDSFSEKLQLLHKVDRKYIRCLFEDPEYVVKDKGVSGAISRLCVAWPFQETIIVDFAGKPEDYGEACLFGTLIESEEKEERGRRPELLTEETGWLDDPQIDSYA